MQVRVLGPVDVVVDGEVRPVPGVRRKAVLAVLGLAAGELVTTDRLVDVVWEDAPPATALNTLQSHISYLRGVLGARSAIVAQAPGYLLADRPQITDLRVALDLIEQGRAAGDAVTCAARLCAALALWRGRPLADVRGQVWLDAQADRLEQIELDALHALVDARLALGEHGQLVPELEHLTRQHPFHEGFHGQLMLALYRAGRQADALATYQRLRRRLGDELGIDPGNAARELEAAILRQDQAIGVPAPPAIRVAEATAGVPVVPRQLPADMAGFTGRTSQLDELDAVLADSAGATLAISGTAGLGKTALAVHWAHRVTDRFPDGQLYVNLRGFDPSGSPVCAEDAVRGFLEAFGVPPDRIPAGLDAQAALYRGLLAGKRALVVLDNARDADQVRPLLPGGSTSVAVVTSRDLLAGLVAADGARPFVLDLPTPDEARELLARRIGADRVAAEPDAVDDIIEGCARLPLALAVVAARASTNPRFPLRTLAAELGDTRDALDALAGGDAATDVRTVFSWSYQRLSPAGARMFRLLGLHPGPEVTPAAAASLAGIPVRDAWTALAELARVHLIVECVPGRYACHDLLCGYAAEQCYAHDDGPSRRAATGRLLDHYLHTAQAAAELLNPHRYAVTPMPVRPGAVVEQLADHARALDWFGAEHLALLAVLRHAAEAGWDSHTWQLAWVLGDILDRRGQWHERATAGRFALAAARRLADPYAEGLAHRLLAHTFTQLGQLDDADRHGRLAIEMYQRAGDHIGQAHAHRNLARALERTGRHVEALDHAQRALDLYRTTGLREGQASALNSVGWYHAQLGDYHCALDVCEQALRLQEELGDRYGQAQTWDSLGYANHHLGRYPEAFDCYRNALDLFRHLGDRGNEADTLIHLGDTHRRTGETGAAQWAWQQALNILDELGHPDADIVRTRLAGPSAGATGSAKCAPVRRPLARAGAGRVAPVPAAFQHSRSS